jgi:hypothetical protein
MSDKTVFIGFVFLVIFAFCSGFLLAKYKYYELIKKKLCYIDWLEKEIRKYQFERGTK